MYEQTISALREAIDGLEIPVDGDALTACMGLLDRLTAKVTCAVGEFDRAELWRDSGATSMTAWLRSSTRRSGREAARFTKTARRLHDLPVLTQAYLDGTMSGSQVQAVVANLNDETAPLFARAEADLVPTLARMPLPDLSIAMQQWAQAATDSLHDPTDPEPRPPERRLHLSRTMDGRRELSGSLDPEAGALAELALRLAETNDVEGEPARTPAQRRADALVDIFRFFLDNQHAHRGGRHRPHLNVVIDYDDLVTRARAHGAGPAGTGWLPDGTMLDGATLQRLACDAGLHRVVTQGRSSILDYGTTTRTVPANLYNALVVRDKHCRFPGCDRPPQWCEAHHIRHWEHLGPTALTNLALFCSRHHHILHLPGWEAELKPDGTLVVTRPDGQVMKSPPPGKPQHLFTEEWDVAA
jgi:hypothetical protein